MESPAPSRPAAGSRYHPRVIKTPLSPPGVPPPESIIRASSSPPYSPSFSAAAMPFDSYHSRSSHHRSSPLGQSTPMAAVDLLQNLERQQLVQRNADLMRQVTELVQVREAVAAELQDARWEARHLAEENNRLQARVDATLVDVGARKVAAGCQTTAESLVEDRLESQRQVVTATPRGRSPELDGAPGGILVMRQAAIRLLQSLQLRTWSAHMAVAPEHVVQNDLEALEASHPEVLSMSSEMIDADMMTAFGPDGVREFVKLSEAVADLAKATQQKSAAATESVSHQNMVLRQSLERQETDEKDLRRRIAELQVAADVQRSSTDGAHLAAQQWEQQAGEHVTRLQEAEAARDKALLECAELKQRLEAAEMAAETALRIRSLADAPGNEGVDVEGMLSPAALLASLHRLETENQLLREAAAAASDQPK